MRRIAGDLGEGVVELDDRAFVIGNEESLLQRIHQGAAELVAVGQIFGAGPLFFVTLCAIQESAGRDIERGQRLQQETQRRG